MVVHLLFARCMKMAVRALLLLSLLKSWFVWCWENGKKNGFFWFFRSNFAVISGRVVWLVSIISWLRVDCGKKVSYYVFGPLWVNCKSFYGNIRKIKNEVTKHCTVHELITWRHFFFYYIASFLLSSMVLYVFHHLHLVSLNKKLSPFFVCSYLAIIWFTVLNSHLTVCKPSRSRLLNPVLLKLFRLVVKAAKIFATQI